MVIAALFCETLRCAGSGRSTRKEAIRANSSSCSGPCRDCQRGKSLHSCGHITGTHHRLNLALSRYMPGHWMKRGMPTSGDRHCDLQCVYKASVIKLFL